MKLEELKIKEVQKLANEAVEVLMKAGSKKIREHMIKMGQIERSTKCTVYNTDGVKEKTFSTHYNVRFFVYSVDFIPNDDYECKEGFEVYGARGNYTAGLCGGPVSFVLIWDEKMGKFFVSEIVFDTHPFSFTEKRIQIK